MNHAFVPFVVSLGASFGLAFLFALFVPFTDVTEEEMEHAEQEA